MEKDSPHAESAFLSVCDTAGDEKTLDEVIHLAAGLRFSEFKSVIGTLWVVDFVVKHVVEGFYKNMFKELKDGAMDCAKAACAVNRAACSVKTRLFSVVYTVLKFYTMNAFNSYTDPQVVAIAR
ncbi:hypothetical protein BDR07DRAFT_1569832 [Suillus spraguei]|nr:hypothetical protein BDR07DRAFT_1569832 [Suillus spraguei]